ncbi:unnamed protein product [Gemmata massiliana]|uniref:Uncharacterized protein n=1 Tax=Gemmata massiliana TaxID=1210884 RepID=A0A6P2D1Q6_9BACT|nr:hypothetical protein [Gemmata massiliana]VTR95258.1 unnamed protein product [Gemmata massiliana]
MPRFSWSDCSTAAELPRVRAERFLGKSKYRVHLLGEVRPIKVHKRAGENTMPCLAPDACPFCADPVWKPKVEWFGPALLQNNKEKLWVPIVAVFTSGGGTKLRSSPPGPHRGRLLEVWRVAQGTAQGGVLHLKELSRVDPLIPAFDVLPHLHRLWFPNEEPIDKVEVPAPIPFTAEEPIPQPKPEPFKLSSDVADSLRSYVNRLRGGDAPKPTQEQPKPAEPAPAAEERPPAGKGGITPNADKVVGAIQRRLNQGHAEDAARQRELRSKPAEELKPGEAVEAGRIFDYVLGGPDPSKNGHATKGGAQ